MADGYPTIHELWTMEWKDTQQQLSDLSDKAQDMNSYMKGDWAPDLNTVASGAAVEAMHSKFVSLKMTFERLDRGLDFLKSTVVVMEKKRALKEKRDGHSER